MYKTSIWGVRITRSISADPHDFRFIEIHIDIYGTNVVPVASTPFRTTTEQFCDRAETTGDFATLKDAVEALTRELNVPFAVWAATRQIDRLIIVGPANEGPPADRYVRLVTSIARRLQWIVDPADLHQPYGGSTTEPALLRGCQGGTRGLVTALLVEQAVDEADAREEPVGIISEGGAPSPHRLVRGRELAAASPETIAFLTRPPGDRSIVGIKPLMSTGRRRMRTGGDFFS